MSYYVKLLHLFQRNVDVLGGDDDWDFDADAYCTLCGRLIYGQNDSSRKVSQQLCVELKKKSSEGINRLNFNSELKWRAETVKKIFFFLPSEKTRRRRRKCETSEFYVIRDVKVWDGSSKHLWDVLRYFHSDTSGRTAYDSISFNDVLGNSSHKQARTSHLFNCYYAMRWGGEMGTHSSWHFALQRKSFETFQFLPAHQQLFVSTVARRCPPSYRPPFAFPILSNSLQFMRICDWWDEFLATKLSWVRSYPSPLEEVWYSAKFYKL